MARRLTRAFFDRVPEELAPDLLNKLLVSRRDDVELAARIVEVEAYCGSTDPASHAFRGQTARNTTMFGPPGHLYVYFTYGMHWGANAVCGPRGTPSAVLLRLILCVVFTMSAALVISGATTGQVGTRTRSTFWNTFFI